MLSYKRRFVYRRYNLAETNMARRLIKNVLFAALVAFCSAACSQDWPQRPVRIVVGFPPGGGIDVVARLLAVRLSDSLGQQVIVDNRPGANGILATEFVAKAPPDGYTLLIGTTGNLSVNPVLFPKLPFNVERDFTPVMQTSSVPFLLYVNPLVPSKSLEEFIGYARANPRKMHFYSTGNGGLPHLAGELFNTVAGIQTVHVPYKGSAPGFNDLIAGQIQFGFDAVPIGLQHVKSGRVRAVATTGPKRLSFLPDVPAASETLRGFEVINWYGFMAPRDTPPAVIERLHRALQKVMSNPETRDKLIEQGTDPVDSNPRTFAAFMKAESAKWARVIREANVKPD
jgi:tripartite-type tricarboxylate transporter receptor subunit TctC